MLPVSISLWIALARPALVLKSDDPSEIPRKMRRRPSSQDWMDVVSWFSMTLFPPALSQKGTSQVEWSWSSSKPTCQQSHCRWLQSGLVQRPISPLWLGEHHGGRTIVLEGILLDLAKIGHRVRGSNDCRWSFHILDRLPGIPDSFQLHPGATRKHLVCSSSLLAKFTIAENGKTPSCFVGGRIKGAVSGYKDRVSITDDVRKKFGESRIGCSRRPHPAAPIEVDDDSGLFIIQLWWNPRWRVGEILDATQFKSSR